MRKIRRSPLTGAETLGVALSDQAFTADQASRLTSCTPHQLRYWDRVGLVSPSVQTTGGRPGVRRLYSFRDLVALRVVRSLLDNGMSLQRVRRAWEYLRRNADFDGHLGSVKLVTDGHSIFSVASSDGELLDALRDGQLAFFVAIDEIARDVEEDVTRFELDRENFLEVLRRVEDDVREEAQ
ncbi:MAG TPA: helix-turn-helix domain-containing protein [Acidimicrobiia bacterium]|nr:helix-turn-helix domain-containing protein [Acidimicrobiia bacterium]